MATLQGTPLASVPPPPSPQVARGPNMRAIEKMLQCETLPDGRPHLGGFYLAVAKARGAMRISNEERSLAQNVLKSWGSDHVQWSVQKTAMVENSGVLGGYLVPPSLKHILIRAMAEKSFIYPRALKVPMPTLEVMLPTPLTSTTGTTAVSPFFGGMQFSTGTTEGGSITETEPQWRSISMKACDMTGFAKMSNDFLSDAGPTSEEYLVELFARAASWHAEYMFLRGTGTANLQPQGMLNSGAAIQVVRQAGSQIQIKDIATMAGKLIPEGWRNAVWIINPSAIPQISQITQYYINVQIADGGGGTMGCLHSRPIYPSEKIPALGTMGDLMFVDPSMYLIGERQEIVVDADPHSAFANNQTNFRMWLRIDGRPWLDAPVTLADGSTQASSIVVLK